MSVPMSSCPRLDLASNPHNQFWQNFHQQYLFWFKNIDTRNYIENIGTPPLENVVEATKLSFTFFTNKLMAPTVLIVLVHKIGL